MREQTASRSSSGRQKKSANGNGQRQVGNGRSMRSSSGGSRSSGSIRSMRSSRGGSSSESNRSRSSRR